MNIKQILDGIKSATGVAPQAFSTTNVQAIPAIAYQIYRSSDNGIIEQWRLQTRITAKTLVEALAIEKAMVETLTTVADEPKFGCYIAVNGGGTLEDTETDMPQIITYFDITTGRY